MLTGSGKVHVEGKLAAEHLDVALPGSGDIVVDQLETGALVASLQGSGTIRVAAGNIDYADFRRLRRRTGRQTRRRGTALSETVPLVEDTQLLIHCFLPPPVELEVVPLVAPPVRELPDWVLFCVEERAPLPLEPVA